VSECKIDLQLNGFANDLRFGELDQRGVNLNASTLDPGFGADVGERFEKRDELRPAIGITAVIDRVCADENVSGRNRFRPGERVREKNCVPRRNIGRRNSDSDFCFRT
jgi:hypothetical protein